MITDREMQRLINELSIEEVSNITLSVNPIAVKVFDQGSKIALATSVYEGGNYIPHSVRRCLNSKSIPWHTSIKTSLKIDENQYKISLNYLGSLEEFTDRKFRYVIEEFNEQADHWRSYLDEHDKNDLIHVRSL